MRLVGAQCPPRRMPLRLAPHHCVPPVSASNGHRIECSARTAAANFRIRVEIDCAGDCAKVLLGRCPLCQRNPMRCSGSYCKPLPQRAPAGESLHAPHLRDLEGRSGLAPLRSLRRYLRHAQQTDCLGTGRHPHFSPRLDALRELPEGRGFSPAEIAASAPCWSRAPRSPAGTGLRGARGTRIIRKAL